MFAGNDAIVAFARSQQVKVVIHQLNNPLWEVNTTTFSVCLYLPSVVYCTLCLSVHEAELDYTARGLRDTQ